MSDQPACVSCPTLYPRGFGAKLNKNGPWELRYGTSPTSGVVRAWSARGGNERVSTLTCSAFGEDDISTAGAQSAQFAEIGAMPWARPDGARRAKLAVTRDSEGQGWRAMDKIGGRIMGRRRTRWGRPFPDRGLHKWARLWHSD